MQLAFKLLVVIFILNKDSHSNDADPNKGESKHGRMRACLTLLGLTKPVIIQHDRVSVFNAANSRVHVYVWFKLGRHKLAKWSLLGSDRSKHKAILLLISGIEPNPGPNNGSPITLDLTLQNYDQQNPLINALGQYFAKMWGTLDQNFAHVIYAISRMEHKFDDGMLNMDLRNDSLRRRIEELDAQLDRMEDFLRQGNMKFIGIDEDDKDGLPGLDKVLALLNKYSSDTKWLPSDITYAYREGTKPVSGNQPRPLVVGFRLAEDKIFILRDQKLRRNLKKLNIKLAHDPTERQKAELEFYKNKGLNAFYKAGQLHIENASHTKELVQGDKKTTHKEQQEDVRTKSQPEVEPKEATSNVWHKSIVDNIDSSVNVNRDKGYGYDPMKILQNSLRNSAETDVGKALKRDDNVKERRSIETGDDDFQIGDELDPKHRRSHQFNGGRRIDYRLEHFHNSSTKRIQEQKLQIVNKNYTNLDIDTNDKRKHVNTRVEDNMEGHCDAWMRNSEKSQMHEDTRPDGNTNGCYDQRKNEYAERHSHDTIGPNENTNSYHDKRKHQYTGRHDDTRSYGSTNGYNDTMSYGNINGHSDKRPRAHTNQHIEEMSYENENGYYCTKQNGNINGFNDTRPYGITNGYNDTRTIETTIGYNDTSLIGSTNGYNDTWENGKANRYNDTNPNAITIGCNYTRPNGSTNGHKDTRPYENTNGNCDTMPNRITNGYSDTLPYVITNGYRDTMPNGNINGYTDTRPSGNINGFNDISPNENTNGYMDIRPSGNTNGHSDTIPFVSLNGYRDTMPNGNINGYMDTRPSGNINGFNDTRPNVNINGYRDIRSNENINGFRDTGPSGNTNGYSGTRPYVNTNGYNDTRPYGNIYTNGHNGTRPNGNYTNEYSDTRPNGNISKYSDTRTNGNTNGYSDKRPYENTNGYSDTRPYANTNGYSDTRPNVNTNGYIVKRPDINTNGQNGRHYGVTQLEDTRPRDDTREQTNSGSLEEERSHGYTGTHNSKQGYDRKNDARGNDDPSRQYGTRKQDDARNNNWTYHNSMEQRKNTDLKEEKERLYFSNNCYDTHNDKEERKKETKNEHREIQRKHTDVSLPSGESDTMASDNKSVSQTNGGIPCEYRDKYSTQITAHDISTKYSCSQTLMLNSPNVHPKPEVYPNEKNISAPTQIPYPQFPPPKYESHNFDPKKIFSCNLGPKETYQSQLPQAWNRSNGENKNFHKSSFTMNPKTTKMKKNTKESTLPIISNKSKKRTRSTNRKVNTENERQIKSHFNLNFSKEDDKPVGVNQHERRNIQNENEKPPTPAVLGEKEENSSPELFAKTKPNAQRPTSSSIEAVIEDQNTESQMTQTSNAETEFHCTPPLFNHFCNEAFKLTQDESGMKASNRKMNRHLGNRFETTAIIHTHHRETDIERIKNDECSKRNEEDPIKKRTIRCGNGKTQREEDTARMDDTKRHQDKQVQDNVETRLSHEMETKTGQNDTEDVFDNKVNGVIKKTPKKQTLTKQEVDKIEVHSTVFIDNLSSREQSTVNVCDKDDNGRCKRFNNDARGEDAYEEDEYINITDDSIDDIKEENQNSDEHNYKNGKAPADLGSCEVEDENDVSNDDDEEEYGAEAERNCDTDDREDEIIEKGGYGNVISENNEDDDEDGDEEYGIDENYDKDDDDDDEDDDDDDDDDNGDNEDDEKLGNDVDDYNGDDDDDDNDDVKNEEEEEERSVGEDDDDKDDEDEDIKEGKTTKKSKHDVPKHMCDGYYGRGALVEKPYYISVDQNSHWISLTNSQKETWNEMDNQSGFLEEDKSKGQQSCVHTERITTGNQNTRLDEEDHTLSGSQENEWISLDSQTLQPISENAIKENKNVYIPIRLLMRTLAGAYWVKAMISTKEMKTIKTAVKDK